MNLEDFIERKAKDHAHLIEQAHHILINAHPGIIHSFKYGLPFYAKRKNLVFLDVQKGKPLMAVYYGIHLKEIHPLLYFGERVLVGHYYFTAMNDQTIAEILTILDAAIVFDSSH